MLVSSLASCSAVYAARASCGSGAMPVTGAASVRARRSRSLADGSRLSIALSPPLDEWSDEWLAAHMVQHELLMVVAAPLIAVGAPWSGLLWAMPLRSRHAVVAAVQRTPCPAVWRTI